ncbi:hypothetical protein EDD16DRAFT_1526117 [Pisolithus croceorrhizus]|nr:hypothetical protein EDD16DRAFT_1526117 [Pisolithus croceorrhizus]
MSQPLSLIPTPLATAVQHWLVVPDSAIQSDKQKVAKEAATQERVEAECQEREAVELHRQEEAEHQEREENECQEKEENECWEREANNTGRGVTELGGGPQVDHMTCAWCTRAKVDCTYELAKANWHTEEMAQLQQMVKTLGSLHHHVIESMVELLQEMTYPELELPTESGSEESEEAKALDEPGWK